MKNALLIILFLLSSAVGATTYYVGPSGSDSNNGSSSAPWKTLAYACTKAKASGDIIQMNAGTYYESGQSNLAVGVSIVGAGMTNTIIESSYTGSSQPLIKLETSNGWLGTNGNQSISGIRFDGNMATFSAIDVNFRSNVLIHDNTFLDFKERAVLFVGQAEASYGGGQIPWDKDPVEGSFPNYWCSGNKFYNNIATNCAIYSGAGSGILRIGTQRGIQIYGNTITQNSRPLGQNGYGIKYYGRGFNRGTKCYNNTITTGPKPEGKYAFSLELWYEMDECEYYGNTIIGEIDIDGCDKFGGAYSVWLHDNTMGFPTQQDHTEYGLNVEAHQTGLIFNNNIIKNVSVGIYFSFIWPIGTHPGDSYYDDIRIYNNLFQNIGYVNGGWSYDEVCGIALNSTRLADDVTNLLIYNNTIVASGNKQSTTYTTAGIKICDSGVTGSNIQIRNNIIKGFTGGTSYSGPICANGTSSITNLKITNNLFYGNGNSNAVKWTGSFSPGSGYDNSSIITSDPLLASDFRLQAGSPAIGTGIAVGLSTDKSGVPWNTKPSIGAFESGSTATSPVIPSYQNSAVENVTPSVLSITYDLSLAGIIPAASSFNVQVNAVARTVSAIAISGNKVQLTLSTAIKYGDIVTVAYTKPATNPLQTLTGGMAITISGKSVVNNLINSTKTITQVTVNMTISPNHVHRIMNALLVYSGDISTLATSLLPQLVRISDTSGKLFIEKVLVTGVTNFKIPLNLRSGVYIVKVIAGGLEMASQKMIVY